MHQRWWSSRCAIRCHVCGNGRGDGIRMHGAIGKCCWGGGDRGSTIEVRRLRMWVRVRDDVVGMRVDGRRGRIVHTDVAVWLSRWVSVGHGDVRDVEERGWAGGRLGEKRGEKSCC